MYTENCRRIERHDQTKSWGNSADSAKLKLQFPQLLWLLDPAVQSGKQFSAKIRG
jgi:hypothetical protein